MFVSKFPRFSCLLLLLVPIWAQDQGQDQGTASSGGGGVLYDGPDILGRGGLGAGNHGTETVPIHVQGAVNGTYDSNLMAYSLDSNGKLVTKSAAGIEAFLGASGKKIWRRSDLGIDYGGNYSHYSGNTYFNGSNHQLNLGYSARLSRKLQFLSQVGAGTSNRFLGGPNVFQTDSFEHMTVPTMELFDSRSYFIGTTTGVIYNPNNRQSIRFTGTGSTVRRKAAGLVDVVTYGGSGDWVYRLSRRTSTGFSYTFSHYDFMKVFGESDVHVLGWHVARKMSRDWDISLSATGMKQRTVGVRNFALDPVLSAILGRSSGTEAFDSSNLLFGYSGSIIRRIRRSTGHLTAQRGIIPGNGYFLTSLNETAELGFTHNFSRDLAVTGFVGYNKLTSLGFAAGAYRGWTGGASVTRKLTESFGINSRWDWRSFEYQINDYGRTGYRVSAGITYFPARGVAGLW